MKNFIYACIVFLVCSCSVKSSNDKIKSLILENDVYELTGFCKKHTKLIKEKGDTYLSYATHPLNEDAVCILIQYGANMHFMMDNQLLIHWAVREDKNKIAFLLIEQGAINDTSILNSVFEIAVESNNIEVLQKLLEQGFDINFKNKKKQTLFDIALENKNYRIAFELLHKKDYVNYLKSEDEQIMQNIINSWDDEFSTGFINVIFPEGIEIHEDSYLLIEAINAYNSSAVNWLVKNGCNASKKEYSSYFDSYVQPIDYAYENQHRLEMADFQSDLYKEKKLEIKKIIQILNLQE